MQLGISLVPRFPASVSPTEPMERYRCAAQNIMRKWVTLLLSDCYPYPATEHDARIVCEHFACQELGRGLYAHESRLVMSAIRDILTAHTILKDLAAMELKAKHKDELREIEARLHRPGRMFA